MKHDIYLSQQLAIVFISLLVAAAQLGPQARAADSGGIPATTGQTLRVSGSMFTNFLTPTNTLGLVTGDLRGVVAATTLELDQAAGRGLVQHEMILENGDRLFFKPAVVQFSPGAANPAFGWLHFAYTNIQVIGGTGKYEGAVGATVAHGSLDSVQGQAVLRYSGTITLKAPAPAAASRLSSVGLKDGHVHLTVMAPAGRPVSAEVSEDLRQWNTLATQAAGTGTVEFVDPAAANSAQRFYRARTE